jgi:hydrogenase expression/formation protein HypC
MGKVDFGGVLKRVCLEYVPEVAVGEYALVHVGFALTRLDEAEAQSVFRLLAELGELPHPDPGGGREVP